jgi:FKBP-type peptidyl-prolyl cis-trans isomerase 2
MTISNAFKALSKSEKQSAIAGHKRMIQMLDNLLVNAKEGDDIELLIGLRKGHVKQMNKLIKSL